MRVAPTDPLHSRVFDTDYLPALRRDNVELERSALVEIKEKSVVCKVRGGARCARAEVSAHSAAQDGRELPADVIVMANGFNITEMGFPMKVRALRRGNLDPLLTCPRAQIYGRNGHDVQSYWKANGGPQVYRGSMMSEFPNLFLCMGPNTGTGHFSYIFTAECVTRFAIRVMAPLLKAPRPTVFDAKAPGARRSPSVNITRQKELEEQVWIQSTSQNMVYSFNWCVRRGVRAASPSADSLAQRLVVRRPGLWPRGRRLPELCVAFHSPPARHALTPPYSPDDVLAALRHAHVQRLRVPGRARAGRPPHAHPPGARHRRHAHPLARADGQVQAGRLRRRPAQGAPGGGQADQVRPRPLSAGASHRRRCGCRTHNRALSQPLPLREALHPSTPPTPFPFSLSMCSVSLF